MVLQMALLHFYGLVVFIIIIYYPSISITHSSVNGHLGRFHVSAVVNSAAVNTEMYVPFRVSFLQIHAQEWVCRSRF